MYLIVGLGNPEEEYANTRHNMGFDAIHKISQKYTAGRAGAALHLCIICIY